MAHGLSCSTACGIFPDQGLNPCPLHWQVDSQPLLCQGSPALTFLNSLAEWEIIMLADVFCINDIIMFHSRGLNSESP